MEISTEIEEEITQENEICNNISKEKFRSEIMPFPGKQIEMQYQENYLVDEQREVQEDVVVNKLSLKQKIDVQKLILEESKQYINIEEQRKIKISAIEQQIIKLQESTQLLKQKIKDEKKIQRRAEVETNNENRKLMDLKNFTESTEEIVIVLRSYVEGFEEQINKLKFAELQGKVLKKYEGSCQTINEKTKEIKLIRSDILNVIHEFNVCKEKLRNEFEKTQNDMKIQEYSFKRKLDELLQGNRQLKDEILKTDQDLNNIQDDELYSCTKMKEILNSKIKQLETLQSNRLRIQELEFERNDLLKSIEYYSSSIDTLTEDVEKLREEKSTMETQLNCLQKETADISEETNIAEMEIICMEQEQHALTEEIQELDEQSNESKMYYDELIKLSYEKEKSLLKNQNISSSLQQELLSYQNSNNNDYNVIQKLKVNVEEMEEGVRRKQEKIETVEKEQVVLTNTKEQLQGTLEKLQQEIKDKNGQLSYQRNTLQVHLENKLNDLENKLKELKKRNEEEKEKFTEIEAANKKKSEQYKRLRNVYFMLKTASPDSKFTELQRKHSYNDIQQENREKIEAEPSSFETSPKHSNNDIQQENREKIEAEPSSFETSPKGILKSPGKIRSPATPTKNVQFVGLPSIASSNSSEIATTNSLEKLDAFDELRSNLPKRKRKRNFD